MANSDKNLVITPNISSSSDDPKIVFSGADGSTGPQNITLKVYPTNSGTLSFEGSSGQLFSISNTMSGTIFSANDVSGIPSIEVLDSGLVKFAQYSGNVLIGTGTDNGTDKLQVTGSIVSTSGVKGTTLTSTVATGTAPFVVASSTMVSNLNSQYWNGNSFSSYLNQAVRTGDSPTFNSVTASSSITVNSLIFNQERSSNARLYTATTGAAGFLLVDSAGSFRAQMYGDGTNYGFLDSTWGNWDLQKTVNGNLSLRVSGTNYTVVHSGNSTSYTSGAVSGLTLNNSSSGINPDSVTQNQLGYNTSVSLLGQTDGGLYSSAYSSSWIHQIYGDFRTGQIMVRGKNSGTWQSWLNIPTFGKSLVFAR